MLKLINGEIYRLLHKKSLYIYFLALGAGYFILAFIRSGGFNEQAIVNDAMNFFNFLPALAGGFLFAAIYTDDLSAKNLTTLVGFGVSKTKIVLAKFVLMALFGAVIFILSPLWLFAVHAVLGWTAAAGTLALVFAVSLKYFLTTLGYAILAGIAVYGWQRPTFAMVLYIILAFNIVGGLVRAFLANMVGDETAYAISSHLLSGITDRIFAGLIGNVPLAAPCLEYAVYAVVVAALSVLAFHKKEMEF
jgi:ABC-type transport system involved in multi-copper enzyme maturation permease subunit